MDMTTLSAISHLLEDPSLAAVSLSEIKQVLEFGVYVGGVLAAIWAATPKGIRAIKRFHRALFRWAMREDIDRWDKHIKDGSVHKGGGPDG